MGEVERTEEDGPRPVIVSIPGSFNFLAGVCVGAAGPRWPLAVIAWLLAICLALATARGVTGIGFFTIVR